MWLGDVDGTDPVVDLNMTGSRCLSAVFGTRLFTTTDGGGSVTLNPASSLCCYGANMRLVAVPTAGNYFAGWSGEASGEFNPRTLAVLNANSTVSASFAPLPGGQFALTIIPDGNGRVNASPRANRYNSGQNVTLTAIPDFGQSFLGWSGDASGAASPVVVTMSQSRMVTAHLSRRPSLGLATCNGRLNPEAIPLLLAGEAGATNQIEFSDDLRAWFPLATVTNCWGVVQFTDRTATNAAQRFYRAVAD